MAAVRPRASPVRVIRLELEVDGEVYPELHAALAAVGNDASRGERLRQLAATGLVWETVRIHGASVALTQDQSPSRASHAEAPRAAGLCVPFGGTSGARTAERSGPRRGHRSDFVDLALNAVPATVPSARELQDPQLHAGARDIPAADVPLLSDVVDAIPPARGAASQSSTTAAQAMLAPAAASEGSRPWTANPHVRRRHLASGRLAAGERQ